MNLKPLIDKIMQLLNRYLLEKFTGKITFTFHIRDGGIGRTQVNIEHDFKN